MGLRFEHVLTEAGARLIEFIQSNPAVRKLNVRLRGTRVELGRPETSAAMGIRDFFRVKKIGLGGRIIETPVRLEGGARFRMEKHLADPMGKIIFRGRCAGSKPVAGSKRPVYDTGIRILLIAERDRKGLETFAAALKAPGPGEARS